MSRILLGPFCPTYSGLAHVLLRCAYFFVSSPANMVGLLSYQLFDHARHEERFLMVPTIAWAVAERNISLINGCPSCFCSGKRGCKDSIDHVPLAGSFHPERTGKRDVINAAFAIWVSPHCSWEGAGDFPFANWDHHPHSYLNCFLEKMLLVLRQLINGLF